MLSFIYNFSFQMMKLIAVRRVQMAQTGKTDVPLPPAPPPHPGYAPNAALHAIKRHAQEFATPKAQAVSIMIYQYQMYVTGFRLILLQHYKVYEFVLIS